MGHPSPTRRPSVSGSGGGAPGSPPGKKNVKHEIVNFAVRKLQDQKDQWVCSNGVEVESVKKLV